MASKSAHKRLTKEALHLRTQPPPFILARPLDSNICNIYPIFPWVHAERISQPFAPVEFHYVIYGPPGTPYENGEYHGKLIFPSEYPYKPPAIKMLTPNGMCSMNTIRLESPWKVIHM
jgi:ubiquitin-conjugating enzyme E2 J2